MSDANLCLDVARVLGKRAFLGTHYSAAPLMCYIGESSTALNEHGLLRSGALAAQAVVPFTPDEGGEDGAEVLESLIRAVPMWDAMEIVREAVIACHTSGMPSPNKFWWAVCKARMAVGRGE